MSNIHSELQDVFRTTFDDDLLVISHETNADEIEGWDSIAHINLIIAIEKRFAVKFSSGDLGSLQAEGKNVGSLIMLLNEKLGSK